MTTFNEIRAALRREFKGEAHFKVSTYGCFLSLRAEVETLKSHDYPALRRRAEQVIEQNFPDLLLDGKAVTPAKEIWMGGLVINYRLA